jgi:hypothetical protein
VERSNSSVLDEIFSILLTKDSEWRKRRATCDIYMPVDMQRARLSSIDGSQKMHEANQAGEETAGFSKSCFL